MNKFRNYDHATKAYISMLVAARDGDLDVRDLIPASASVQDALSEVRDLNKADTDYVDAVSAVIKTLSDAVKGRPCDDANLSVLLADLSAMRRRVIVEDTAEGSFDFAFLAKTPSVGATMAA